MQESGLQVENLFSGCACCSVSGELISTITKIKQNYEPEWIILETTEIAYPKKIQENLKEYLKMDTRITVLVDAVRWNRLLIPLNHLLARQIKDPSRNYSFSEKKLLYPSPNISVALVTIINASASSCLTTSSTRGACCLRTTHMRISLSSRLYPPLPFR